MIATGNGPNDMWGEYFPYLTQKGLSGVLFDFECCVVKRDNGICTSKNVSRGGWVEPQNPRENGLSEPSGVGGLFTDHRAGLCNEPYIYSNGGLDTTNLKSGVPNRGLSRRWSVDH